MLTTEMLRTHPQRTSWSEEAVAECIRACVACEQACVACADACLSEEMVGQLRACIRLNLDCADVCASTGRVLSRQTSPDPELVRAQVELLALACRKCGDECGRHAPKHEHCRLCEEACRSCEKACRQFLGSLAH